MHPAPPPLPAAPPAAAPPEPPVVTPAPLAPEASPPSPPVEMPPAPAGELAPPEEEEPPPPGAAGATVSDEHPAQAKTVNTAARRSNRILITLVAGPAGLNRFPCPRAKAPGHIETFVFSKPGSAGLTSREPAKQPSLLAWSGVSPASAGLSSRCSALPRVSTRGSPPYGEGPSTLTFIVAEILPGPGRPTTAFAPSLSNAGRQNTEPRRTVVSP